MFIPSLNVFTTTDKVEFIENGEANELSKKEFINNINVDVPVSNTKANIKYYNYLINTLHYNWDDCQLFKTTKITIENDNIVAYRRAINKSGKTIGRTDGPFHIYDIEKYTKAYNKKLTEVNRLIPTDTDSDTYIGTHECLFALNAMSNDDNDMPVHDRDSSSYNSTSNGTERGELGTPNITDFQGKRSNSNDDDDNNNIYINSKKNRDIDSTTTKCKISKLYNYDMSIHRLNLTNKLPHSLTSILTFNYFI